MSTNRFGLIFCSTVLFAAVAFGAHSYENDFATRMSGAVPDGRWHALPYVCDRLAFNITSGYTDETPWSSDNASKMQDNWRKVKTADDVAFSCWVTNDMAGANQYFRLQTTKTAQQNVCAIANTFCNSISNGTLRIAFDFRGPQQWPADGSAYLRIQPLTRRALEKLECFEEPILFSFGFQKQNAANETRAIYSFYDSTRTTSDNRDSWGTCGNLTAGRWYRLSADLDVAAGKVAAVHFYGGWGQQPSLDTPDGEALWEVTDKTDRYTKGTITPDNPVEGLAFRASKITADADLVVDNLVCSWKAPGADAFERFYENDFALRRYRRLEQPGSTTHDYACDQSVTEVVCAKYDEVLLPRETNTATSANAILPSGTGIGYAGWRRCSNGAAELAAVKFNGSQGMLCARSANGDGYVIATQTLGEDISSGVVRLSCDFRTPDKWYWADYRNLYVALGDASIYGLSSSPASHWAARFGIAAKKQSDGGKAGDFRGYSHFGSGVYGDTNFKSNRWYRSVLTVDLTKRRCEGKLYDLGAEAQSIDYVPTKDPVYTYAADGIANDLKKIGAFALLAYGTKTTKVKASASAPDGQAYFDNVQVWKDWNESAGTGTLVYRDSFTSQKRCFDAQARGEVLGYYQLDDGQDHWVRRHNGSGGLWVTSGENPALASAGGELAYGVHPLGLRFEKGFAYAQVDVRPPRRWAEKGAYALVTIGDDLYLQGCMSKLGPGQFLNHAGPSFGFGEPGDATATNGFYPTVKIRYAEGDKNGGMTARYVGDAVTSKNWFRFKVVCNLDANTYDLSVYDLGVDHPTLDTKESANGLVAEVKDIPFRSVPQNGLMAMGVSIKGNQPLYPYDLEDAGAAIFDNVRVWNDVPGTAIILR